MSKISLRSRKSIVFVLALCLSFLLSSCFGYTMKEKMYYSQKDNYVNATGIITHINEGTSALYLGFSDLSPQFDDNSFKIVGDN